MCKQLRDQTQKIAKPANSLKVGSEASLSEPTKKVEARVMGHALSKIRL